MRVFCKKSIYLILFVTLVVSFFGFESFATSSKPYKIPFVIQYSLIEFFVPARIGVLDATKEFGIDVDWLGPEDMSITGTISIVETVLQQGIDGLVVQSGNAYEMLPVVTKAKEMGIPVIYTNQLQPIEGYDGFCGVDDFKAGEEMGKQAERIFNEAGKELEGKVAYLLDVPGSPRMEMRIKGAMDYLSKFPQLQNIGTYDGTITVEKGREVVANLLTAHPDLNLIIAVAASNLPAACLAVQEQNLVGDVVLIGMDLIPMSLQFVKEGVAQAIIGQDPYGQGYLPLKAIYEYLEFNKPIPKQIATEIEVVTKDNVDEIIARENKYLEQGTKLTTKE